VTTNYIFFSTGGVVSSVGKGVTAAAIGRILKNAATLLRQKLDPYINVDPGTRALSHGEVFVTDDGAETDGSAIMNAYRQSA